MGTIADACAAGDIYFSAEDKDFGDLIDKALSSLELPWEGNHTLVPHSSLGPIFAQESKGFAARFCFDEAMVASSHNVSRDAESYEIAARIARLPAPQGWYEWREHGVSRALWWEQQTDGTLDCLFLCKSGDSVFVAGAIRRWQFGHWRKVCYNVGDVLDFVKMDDEEKNLLLSEYLRFAVCGSALLNLHRAVQVEAQHAAPKLQRARAKRGKLPLLSFNRVKLKLPKPDLTRGEYRGRGHPGVRFHQVIGHLRLLQAGRIEPVFIWVDAFWRGDARLGVILREREVTVRNPWSDSSLKSTPVTSSAESNNLPG
jgi:hypothetical protein